MIEESGRTSTTNNLDPFILKTVERDAQNVPDEYVIFYHLTVKGGGHTMVYVNYINNYHNVFPKFSLFPEATVNLFHNAEF